MPVDYELEYKKRDLRKQLKWWLDDVEESQLEINGVTYHAGYNSGQRLDAARRLSIEAGLTHVQYADVNNEYHTLTIAEATTVCLTIGQDFQMKFAQKQAWAQQINNATSLAELPTIE